jgi:hypothetical protein
MMMMMFLTLMMMLQRLGFLMIIIKVRKKIGLMLHQYFHSCAQLTSFFLLSFYTVNSYNTPTKAKNNKGSRTTYVGGDNENALGEKIVVYLPDGFVFVLLWVDARLDKDILQFIVSEDGKSIIQRKKKPLPTSASHMLQMVYGFARDPKHMVVAQVEAELLRLKAEARPNKEWDEQTIVVFNEEVLKTFYDHKGADTNQIQYHRDQADGRQWISFFVKTLRAQDAPKVGDFCNDDQGMADDDDDELTTSTAELRQEMDERIARLEGSMTQKNEQMMRQSQEATRQMFEQFMNMNMANNNNQQQQQPALTQEQYAAQQAAALAYQQRLAAEALAARPDVPTS